VGAGVEWKKIEDESERERKKRTAGFEIPFIFSCWNTASTLSANQQSPFWM
jgi:hypothetical protein